jgi:hypothetical protein
MSERPWQQGLRSEYRAAAVVRQVRDAFGRLGRARPHVSVSMDGARRPTYLVRFDEDGALELARILTPPSWPPPNPKQQRFPPGVE